MLDPSCDLTVTLFWRDGLSLSASSLDLLGVESQGCGLHVQPLRSLVVLGVLALRGAHVMRRSALGPRDQPQFAVADVDFHGFHDRATLAGVLAAVYHSPILEAAQACGPTTLLDPAATCAPARSTEGDDCSRNSSRRQRRL